MNSKPSTPADAGYRMPAEWAPQDATWLIWPEHPDHWFADLEAIRFSIAKLAAEISLVQRAHLLVNDGDAGELAKRTLARAGADLARVRFHEIPTDLCWIRDCGPTFVLRPEAGPERLAAVLWGYNAWGGKYPPWDNDAAVARKVAELVGVPTFEPGIILEGGSIETNGRGLFLTTEQCLLHPNRNPGKSREDLETYLHDYLGSEKVIWLGEGIEGDDTDGHIDDLSRFVNEDTVLTMIEPDSADVNHIPLRENLRRLELATDQHGRRLNVATLEMPPPVVFEGMRFPASYANYYLANGKTIVPTFGNIESDRRAAETLARLFPDRKVVPIQARELVTGFGAFHCFTQQQPRTSE